MKRNIKLIYIISSLMWMRFFIPVLALFYIASQVPIEQFTIIMSVFALVTLLLEVPSGVVADLLGKKRTLLISRFLYVAEIFLIAFYNGFWIFLLAKIISGIGVSLSSGTSEALLYDTLKKDKRESEHKKVSGKLFTITNISMAFAFIIGAFLFSIDSKLPAMVSLPFIIVGFLLTFLIKEPYKSSKNLTLKNSFLHLKEGFGYFCKHKHVKYLVLYSLPVGASISIMLSMSSVYMEKIMIPIYLIGTMAFIASMITAVSSKKAESLEKRLGEKKFIYFIQIALFLGLVTMSLMVSYIGIIFYMIIPLVAGFFVVITDNYMNNHIETSHRATMLSIKNLFINIGIFIMFPIIGFISEKQSMGTSFSYLSGFVLLYLIGLLLYSRKLKMWK